MKTTAQMGALVVLLWRPTIEAEWFGFVLLYIATVLTFWSMFQYLSAAWSDLREA